MYVVSTPSDELDKYTHRTQEPREWGSVKTKQKGVDCLASPIAFHKNVTRKKSAPFKLAIVFPLWLLHVHECFSTTCTHRFFVLWLLSIRSSSVQVLGSTQTETEDVENPTIIRSPAIPYGCSIYVLNSNELPFEHTRLCGARIQCEIERTMFRAFYSSHSTAMNKKANVKLHRRCVSGRHAAGQFIRRGAMAFHCVPKRNSACCVARIAHTWRVCLLISSYLHHWINSLRVWRAAWRTHTHILQSNDAWQKTPTIGVVCVCVCGRYLCDSIKTRLFGAMHDLSFSFCEDVAFQRSGANSSCTQFVSLRTVSFTALMPCHQIRSVTAALRAMEMSRFVKLNVKGFICCYCVRRWRMHGGTIEWHLSFKMPLINFSLPCVFIDSIYVGSRTHPRQCTRQQFLALYGKFVCLFLFDVLPRLLLNICIYPLGCRSVARMSTCSHLKRTLSLPVFAGPPSSRRTADTYGIGFLCDWNKA